MSEQAASWLEARLRETSCFLEYGAGGSTRLAASLDVPRIISVESDRAFAKAVREMVDISGSKSILNLLAVDVGATGDWGCPLNFDAFRRWPNYSLNVWNFLFKNGLSPDLILIDGRFRLGCFFASLLEARPGTIIMFDDYLSRRNIYGPVEHFLAPSETIDPCAIFVVPETLPRRGIARALARFVNYPE